MTYAEKLKDPRWQKKRLKIFERDNFTCVECGNDKMTLHVHHEEYFSDTEPWDYEDSILKTLCENCHTQKHIKQYNSEQTAPDIWEFIPHEDIKALTKALKENQKKLLYQYDKNGEIPEELMLIHKNLTLDRSKLYQKYYG